MDRKFSVFLALLGTTLASFAINWDNAWIRGTTPGGKVFFEPNEEMAFSLTLEGVKEALPADTYFVDWKRRGDDGVTERGRAPLPFPKDGLVLKTKSAKPGFVCLEANVVTKDGKRMNGNGSWGGDWTGQAEFKRLRSTYRPACWFPDMAYFDPVFAAKRISCPVNISFSGLGDYVSTPASLTLIYRNLKGPKKITYVQGSTHGWRPSGMQRCEVEDRLAAK